jgi:hypothetical protein
MKPFFGAFFFFALPGERTEGFALRPALRGEGDGDLITARIFGFDDDIGKGGQALATALVPPLVNS